MTKPAVTFSRSAPIQFCAHHPSGSMKRCAKHHRAGALNITVRLGFYAAGGVILSTHTHCEPARAPKRRKAPTPYR